MSQNLVDLHNASIRGTGNEVVVLGHGFGTDQSVWRHLVPHLEDDYRVVLYDLMGSGNTDPQHFNHARYSNLHGYADDLLALLEELEIETCIYVGHSVSGMVGCLASLERPHAFSKIILLSASPRYLNDGDYEGGFEQEEVDELLGSLQANFTAWVSEFAPMVAGPAVQEFARTLLGMRPDIALSVVETVLESDVRWLLPRVTVPCHILQGNMDRAVPRGVAHYLDRWLGAATVLEILPTEGHLPQLSSPEIVVPALVRHIVAR